MYLIKKIGKLNNDLEKYIEHNGYYNDQKKKEGLDKYFSDLKSGKPQIYGLYWSKAQIKIRHSQKMAKIKKFLNNLWVFKNEEYKVFEPHRELSYADRIRRREPGDDSLGLSPHCDAGSVEGGSILRIKKFIMIYLLIDLKILIHLMQNSEIGQ